MYQYVFDSETTNKVKDSTSASKNILEEFNKVDKKYSTISSYKDLDLKEMTYSKPTQEDVLQSATTSLSAYKNSGINDINSTYQKQSEKIDSNIQKVQDESQAQKQEIKNTYSEVKQDAENDAIKRGLARSSIIVNKLAGLDEKMLNDLSVLSENTSNKVFELNTQKNALELEKNSALNNFNIEYAVKLQEKIDSLNKDILNQEQAVTKYNNQIAELKAKWEKQQEDDAYDKSMDMVKLLQNGGTIALDIAKQNEKYELAKQYFSGIDKVQAISELESNSIYKESMGANNYNKLLKSLKA